MSKLPLPPERLPPLRTSEVRRLAAGTQVWRIYLAARPHRSDWRAFRHFGPLTTGRFDHHLALAGEQDRGIMYAATFGPVAFAEVFQSTKVINRTRREPWLAGFELAEELVLLDLTRRWPTRAGASEEISSGRRDVARAWSRSVYEQYPDILGLSYPSSMYGGRPSLALNERAEACLPDRPSFHSPLTHAGLDAAIQQVANEVGYRVL